MQDNAMSRWLSPLMAFGLSFIIIATLAPMTGIQVERQLDFWLLWLATMLILALPITYLEIALAKRSKTTALQALSSLTRDADASQKWRLVGWLAVVFIPFLAGGLLSNAAQILNQYAAADLASHVLFVIVAVLALALSLVPRQILLLFYPLSCLVMIVLALPFAYLHFRSGIITTAMFAGIIVGIGFFLLNNVFEYVGNLRAWAPWFIAAVPSLTYMLASLLTFRWLVRNR